MISSVKSSCILVRLERRTGLRHRRRGDVEREVDRNHNAAEAGSYYVRLFDSKSMKDVNAALYAARETVIDMTAPWFEGVRLLRIDKLDDFASKMAGRIADVDQQADALAARYDDLVNVAKARLGTLFDPDMYPSRDVFRASYSVRVEYLPFADQHAALTRYGFDDIVAQIERDIEERMIDSLASLVDETVDQARNISQIVGRIETHESAGALPVEFTRRLRSDSLARLQKLVDKLRDYNVGSLPSVTTVADTVEQDVIQPFEALLGDKTCDNLVAAKERMAAAAAKLEGLL